LEMNKDNLYPHLISLIQLESKDPFVRTLGPADDSKKGNNNKAPSTVSLRFKNQLLALSSTLSGTVPHYVRCIKTSASKENQFDDQYALLQLKCTGMIDAVKIRKLGYAFRCTYDQFCNRYRLLVPLEFSIGRDFAVILLNKITKNQPSKDWQIGATKVFFEGKNVQFA